MSPIPNHCIDCDKISTVTLDNVPYCPECGLKAQQGLIDSYFKDTNKDKRNGKDEKEIGRRYDDAS